MLALYCRSDMLFVGPNDLASSLGYRAADHEDNPIIQEAIERVRKAALKAGKYSGMFCTQPEQVSYGEKQQSGQTGLISIFFR